MLFHAARHNALEEGSEEIPVHQKVLIMALILAINFFENKILDM
jgi:hypothetical protein